MTDSLHTLLANHKPGHSLAAPFYTGTAIFERDMEVIFGRHWIFAGVEPDVPQPGDCMSVDIGPHAVLITRDDGMALHAFHNVCRHRGARLVHTPHVNLANIVCPYHQWTYGMDGTLLYAAHMPQNFDHACHSLRPVHVRSLQGLLFICLADEAPTDIDDMEETVAPYIAPHDISGCKIAHTEDIIEHGNWKLTMENNRECYHCSAAHPELNRSIFAEGFGFAPVNPAGAARAARFTEIVRASHAAWEQAGLASVEIERLDNRTTGFRTERLPLEDAGESETLDTKVACQRLLGALHTKRLGALSLWTQPNSWHHFMSDHIVSFAVFPLATEKTLLRTKWLVHRDAVEGKDYDRANLTAVWHATNQQDSDLVAKAQQGVGCTGYQPGPYAPDTEGLVEKFDSWYIQRMRALLHP